MLHNVVAVITLFLFVENLCLTFWLYVVVFSLLHSIDVLFVLFVFSGLWKNYSYKSSSYHIVLSNVQCA